MANIIVNYADSLGKMKIMHPVYDFEYTDKNVAAIESVGAHTFYSLGFCIEQGKEFGTLPPKGPLKWEQI